jgi:hypothetical protein
MVIYSKDERSVHRIYMKLSLHLKLMLKTQWQLKFSVHFYVCDFFYFYVEENKEIKKTKTKQNK